MSKIGQNVNTNQLNKFLEHIFNRNNQLHAAHAGADLGWRAMEAVGGSQ